MRKFIRSSKIINWSNHFFPMNYWFNIIIFTECSVSLPRIDADMPSAIYHTENNSEENCLPVNMTLAHNTKHTLGSSTYYGDGLNSGILESSLFRFFVQLVWVRVCILLRRNELFKLQRYGFYFFALIPMTDVQKITLIATALIPLSNFRLGCCCK